MKTSSETGYVGGIVVFKRAIERAPNFASGYACLGRCYANTGQMEAGREYTRKAYELRDRASEREKFRISVMYRSGTEEFEKAEEVAHPWAEEYPRDRLEHLDLGLPLRALGQHEAALRAYLEALRLDPDDGPTYARLMGSYTGMDRLDEAKAVYHQAVARNIDFPGLHFQRYKIAFLERDEAEMARQMAWVANKPSVEDFFLDAASHTEDYYGRLHRGRKLTQSAIEAGQRNNRKETAAAYEVDASWREVSYGNFAQARDGAKAALARAPTRGVQTEAAVT